MAQAALMKLQSQQMDSAEVAQTEIVPCQFQSAGMETIQSLLRESTLHISAVTAGQLYEDCVMQTQVQRLLYVRVNWHRYWL